MEASSKSSRPTAWIAIAAVCALAAIGLGVWALTTRSDLDAADATIARQQRQLDAVRATRAEEAQEAADVEATERAYSERVTARYRRVRRRYLAERQAAAQLQAEIERDTTALREARQELGAAQGAEEREAASLRAAQAAQRLSASCARGTLGSIDRFFDATDAEAGANAAVRRLEELRARCEAAIGSG